MTLILGISKLLALEDMAQMASAIVTHDFRALHTKTGVVALAYRTRYSIPKSGPSAARVEFVTGLVEGR